MCMARTRRAPRPQGATSVVPEKLEQPHVDTWQNAATGFGILGKDKRLSVSYQPDLLDPNTCEALWRGSDLAARAIELVPDEMLREGWEVVIDDDKELSDALELEDARLNATETWRSALHTARAMGGSAVFVGTKDTGKNLALPLTEDRIPEIEFLTVLSPQELWAERWYNDPTKPKYGEVALWRMVPVGMPPGANIAQFPLVHESRILKFNGVRTTRKFRFSGAQPGWDDSILCRAVEVLADFGAAFQGTGMLVADFSVPVLRMKELARMLSTKQGQAALADRAAGIEAARSIARVLILDVEEEYVRQTTSVAGLSDVLHVLILRLAAALKLPVGLMMGQGPTGLNSTGEADMRWFNDQVSGERKKDLEPNLMRYYRLLMLAKAGPAGGRLPEKWSIKFNALVQPTDLETATIRKTTADTDAVYIANQVVTPEEIGRSRFGGAGYSTETQIDLDLRDQLMDPELQAEQLGAQAKATAQENEEKALEQPVVAAPGLKGGGSGA